jgi:DNA-binding MarR family transcriptional regulator
MVARPACKSRRSRLAIVITVIATRHTLAVDAYVVDVLMRDLAGHDRSPAAFLVYLYLWRRTRAESRAGVRLSHQDIADEVGLSKSAVQQALRILHRRSLVKSKQRHRTDTPEHQVMRPWAR